MPNKGRFITLERGKDQYDDFWTNNNNGELPRAVCYHVSDLESFLYTVKASLEAANIPPEEQGIALILGTHLDSNSSYADGKPTIMLAAIQFRDNEDPDAGKADAIHNGIMSGGWDPDEPANFEDVVFDSGSLFP